MRRSIATCLVSLAIASTARADDGELHLGLLPTVVVMDRHGKWNLGVGVNTRVSFGMLDYLELGGELGCSRFTALADERAGANERVYYDSVRCEAIPTVAVRLGTQAVVVVLAGVGYRYESRDNRDLVGPQDTLIEALEPETVHQPVARVGVAAEYRWFDTLSAQLHVRVDKPLSGVATGLEIVGGIFLGIYFYPY